MKPNYDTLLVAGMEYRDAFNALKRAYPHGMTLYNETHWADPRARLSRTYDKAEAVLYALADFSEIPWPVMVAAARIEERYYERGGTQCLDSERLIRALLPA